MKRLCILAFAACGGSGDHPDATPADAVESQGSVTVIVTERGTPVAGLPVLFLSQTEPPFSAVTSADGSCGKNLMTGGSVTVLFPKARYGIDRLMTFTDVEMSDLLHIDLERPEPRAVEVAVTASDAAQPGPYVLYTTCGGEEPFGLVAGVNTPVTMYCEDATVDLLVLRIDPDTNQPLRSAFVANVGANTETTLTTFSDVQSLGITYTGFGSYEYVNTTDLLISQHGRLFEAFTGGNPQTQGTTPIPPIARPTNAGMRSVLASTAWPLPSELDQQVVYTPTDISGASTTISLGSRLPAYLDQQTVPGQPPIVGVFANDKLAWREGSGTVSSDLVRAKLRFYRDDIPVGVSWSWEIVSKRAPAPELGFPKLTTPMFEAFAPIATDTAVVQELENVKLPDGLTKDVRQNGFGDVNAFFSSIVGKEMVVQRRWFEDGL